MSSFWLVYFCILAIGYSYCVAGAIVALTVTFGHEVLGWKKCDQAVFFRVTLRPVEIVWQNVIGPLCQHLVVPVWSICIYEPALGWWYILSPMLVRPRTKKEWQAVMVSLIERVKCDEIDPEKFRVGMYQGLKGLGYHNLAEFHFGKDMPCCYEVRDCFLVPRLEAGYFDLESEDERTADRMGEVDVMAARLSRTQTYRAA